MTRDPAAVSLGAAIRAARVAAGLTRPALARLLGNTPATIYLWERGDRQPPILALVPLAKALGVEPAALVAGLGLPPKRRRGVSWRPK